MSSKPAPAVIGRGAPNLDLLPEEQISILEEALLRVAPGTRVLAILPDKTRDDNTDILFPAAAKILRKHGVTVFDGLIAQGTHSAMRTEEKLTKTGLHKKRDIFDGRIFDHNWNDPQELIHIGTLAADRVRSITKGLIDYDIPLHLNKLLANGMYDLLLVFSATVPHEVAGFAGGAKYFFPGVAGPDLTHATHWLGALAEIASIIGRVETPVRALIEAAADFIPTPIISLNSVVTRDHRGKLRVHAIFAGDLREAFRRAAEVSQKVHIRYTGRQYRRVVALLDEHYDDLWVGGKASYKLGAIIKEGGELIIYAPHMTSVSSMHGRLIEKYGYAPLQKVRLMVEHSTELQQNLCVAAHLAHVVYAGRSDESGDTLWRYRITLASAIDEETCRRVNLGFMNPRTFRREDYINDPDALIVERAGTDLYLVEPVRG